MDTVTMYRPTGDNELDLVKASAFKRWPQRLPEQPIFYPVTNEQYACEIAEKWNAKDGKRGYVMKFEVQEDFVDRYEVHCVGASHHSEWWIPAEELEELNDSIVGEISIIRTFDPTT